MKKFLLALALVVFPLALSFAQNEARFSQFNKSYLTYPFSDPDPIPSSRKIYPYFRFDGFSHQGEEREWKVVLLENDYISVQIMPEIGGKIWTATDKKSARDFLYNNDAVKFRDIAMRGPWASGGIEINYGIIGHTPNTSTPVDYQVRKNQDGSVSCFVSTLDLLTRTRWVVEIKLEEDKAYFTTRSFWFNGTGVEQPYYTWMNAAIPEGQKLRFLYPGTHSIGHGGEARGWPIDDRGRDLSEYGQNNFGGSKSYHIVGSHTNYFGALWEEDDFGMIRYSKREDKLGKKIFLWSLAGSGKIWEELLTDNSGQYVEIQSGRLFNQNQFQSSFTPFKQIGFRPYNTDNWTEYWYPFSGLDGFTTANLIGAFKINQNAQQIGVHLSPVQPVQDSLYVLNQDNKVLAAAWLEAKPLDAVRVDLEIPRGETPAKIILKGEALDLVDDKKLSRPVVLAEGFDANGAYGLYLQGRDLAGLRQYQEAATKIRASLDKDPLLLPALVEMSKLELFRMQYDSAFYFAHKALSVDTYDGAANYYYGKAAQKLGKIYDAMDGFEVATLTPEYRSAAYAALAALHMQEKNPIKAKTYAAHSLLNNTENLQSLQLLHLIAREGGDEEAMKYFSSQIYRLNPVDHFLRFESYLQSPTEQNLSDFTEAIRNEMPVETYLELAMIYFHWGRFDESKKILQLAPQNMEVLYWLAWLNREESNASQIYLDRAAQVYPDFVFPFREESAEVLNWASSKDPTWRADYLLALIEDFRGNGEEALSRLMRHADVDFAPYYVLRARLRPEKNKREQLADVDSAVSIDPNQWRYGMLKSKLLMRMDKEQEAVRTLQEIYQVNKDNYIIGLELTRQLVMSERYVEADSVLNQLHVLPFEGATDARRLYRQTKLMLAQAALDKKDHPSALSYVAEAEEWPERLGVGKPFPSDIDMDLENWMKYLIHSQSGDQLEAEHLLKQVKNKKINQENYLQMIRSISGNTDQRIF
jgi:tetratricopeptide (TPR) repeat protein